MSFYADPDPGSQKCPYGSKEINKEEKLHRQIFNSIFQNDIKESLKINKQNINLSISKGSLLLFFQLLFKAFLPPGSGYTSVHAEPDPCGSGSETLCYLASKAYSRV